MINHHSRILDLEDKNIVYNLLERCNDYFQMINGYPVTIEDLENIYHELPDNHTAEDKFLIGIFTENKRLIGLIHFLRNHPIENSWCLGLMLVDPEFRSSGLGRKFYDEVEEWAVDLGAEIIRLGVIDRNQKAQKFWTTLGFKEIERKERKYGLLNSTLIIMTRHPVD